MKHTKGTLEEVARMLEKKVNELYTERDTLKAEVEELKGKLGNDELWREDMQRKDKIRGDIITELATKNKTLKSLNAVLLEALKKGKKLIQCY